MINEPYEPSLELIAAHMLRFKKQKLRKKRKSIPKTATPVSSKDSIKSVRYTKYIGNS